MTTTRALILLCAALSVAIGLLIGWSAAEAKQQMDAEPPAIIYTPMLLPGQVVAFTGGPLGG